MQRFNVSRIYAYVFILSVSTSWAAEEKVRQVPTLASSFVSVLLALIFIIAIIVGCAWVLKRMGGGTFTRSDSIEVKASYLLGAKERLLIVKVDGKHLLLGVTPQSISKLDELSENCVKTDVSAPMSFQDAFSSQFKKMMGKEHEK